MPDRALIIAIENYHHVTGGFIAKKLDGVLAQAQAFRDWLEKKWREEGTGGHSILFCSEPSLPGGLGAGSPDIIEALIQLQRDGRNQTDNLFVYFSGHGFCAKGETIKLADVLVCADFIDTRRSVASCFKLDALVAGLRGSLGHGCHFHFVDACRNEVKDATASPITWFDGKGDEDPSVFVVKSTVAGAPALVAGPFAKTLNLGLRGTGRAKAWDPPITDSMKVQFNSLFNFLQKGLAKKQPITRVVDGGKAETEAILATIKPVGTRTLKITVKTSKSAVRGSATIKVFNGAPKAYEIRATTSDIPLLPNDYTVALTLDDLEVTPAGPVTVDLYEDNELVFNEIGGLESLRLDGTPPPTGEPPGSVRLSIPPGTQLTMQHDGSGHKLEFDSSTSAEVLPEGTYRTILRKVKGHVISIDDFTVAPQGAAEIAPAAWQGDPVRESIASQFPQHSGGIDFSESLRGPITDPDLGVWLAIIGGGRVLGSQGDYSKIGPLPMSNFSGEPRNSAPIYVLAGLPDFNMKLVVGVGDGRTPTLPTLPAQTPGLQGVWEVVIHRPAGQWFVTLGIADQPAYTLATFASPNRCSLIVVTLDKDGQPLIAQYLLPIGHLTQYLNPRVRDLLSARNQLKDVHVLALLSRAFRHRRRIKDEFKESELDQLLSSKWLDPIGASLAAYESVRRGRAAAGGLSKVAHNMQKYFRDLPDTAAIVRLAGKSARPPNGVPLFLDGLSAFRDNEIQLPFPAGLLDFSDPWTSWRGAVKIDGPR